MTLTTKQQLFINHYLANGANGVQAARSAGYKGNDATLSAVSKENLRKPLITAEIEKAQEEIKSSLGTTAENKRKMLWEAANRCMQTEPVLDHNGEPTGEYKFDCAGVVRAIAELNKMDGDYAIKKTESKQTVNIITDEDEQGLF